MLWRIATITRSAATPPAITASTASDSWAAMATPSAATPPAVAAQSVATSASGIYTVEVEGQSYVVKVSSGGDVTDVASAGSTQQPAAQSSSGGFAVAAPLSGNIFKLNVAVGDQVAAGDVVVVLEAMKMETEIRAAQGGTVQSVATSVGDTVAAGATLLTLA